MQVIIEINRIKKNDECCIGTISVDGEFAGFTLEDPERDEKIAGITAIPTGIYNLELREEGGMLRRYQNKFGEIVHPGMLWLRDVPDFDWVYLHIGNTAKDSEGCILVGSVYDIRQPDVIGASTVAYKNIHGMIMGAINRGEDVHVSVE
jgi:hypothetical protein